MQFDRELNLRLFCAWAGALTSEQRSALLHLCRVSVSGAGGWQGAHCTRQTLTLGRPCRPLGSGLSARELGRAGGILRAFSPVF